MTKQAHAPGSEHPPLKKNKPEVKWYVLPHSLKSSYQIGDRVFLRSKSAKELGRHGFVLQASNGRVHVRLDDGTEKSVQLKRLIPLLTGKSTLQQKIIVTSETKPYRNLAASQITKKDHVLEIGCSTGESSIILSKYSASWIGFDNSDRIISQCQAKFHSDDTGRAISNCVYKVDAMAEPVRARDLVKNFPTAIFIDIGGNRDLDGVLKMISWGLQSFDPRLIVVKSRELVKKMLNSDSIDSTQLPSSNGFTVDGTEWFNQLVKKISLKVPTHPLQAERRCVPSTETPICRYHNYHPEGCKKHKFGECDFDHVFCHFCLEKGHVARLCKKIPGGR